MGPQSTAGDDPSRYRDKATFEYWEEREPLKRFRNYLSRCGLWSDEHEEQLKKEDVREIERGMEEAEAQPDMTIAESLEWMYANPPANILDQIEKYQEKGV